MVSAPPKPTTPVAHYHHKLPYAAVLAVCPDCDSGLCEHCQKTHPNRCGRETVRQLDIDNLEVD